VEEYECKSGEKKQISLLSTLHISYYFLERI